MLTGQTLGPYRVLEKIGEGGMGRVFRARDAKLNRDVALKVLPDSFANDADRLARFTREAQTLASLNHPNIAAIYGLEESGGEEESGSDPNKHVGVRPRTTALVMELVEGEDLSQLLARLRAPGASAGQAGMPLDEALPIAKQIAEALEAAHEQGIIHRDLKPANIKVRADGVVKVLDFGLAKALAPAGSRDPAYENLTQSPTLTTPAHLRQGYGAAGTEAGMILGTAAYMSPEQARGKPVDKRTDIWAFGAVLYEMLAGVRPFDGEDATEMIAAVVKTTPDWSALPADVPRPIVALIQRCLEKDRKARVGDIAVARFLLADIAALESSTGAKSQGFEPKAQSPKPVAPWRQMLPWAVTAAALAAAVTVQAPWRVDTPVDRPLVRLDVDLGADVSLPTTVSENGNGGNSLTISPDGTRLVYVSGDGTQRRLFTRRLDQEKATELPGTDGGAHPFFSPDGQWIGFFSRGTVRKISVEGGAVVRLLANITSTAGGGSWADDGSIIASDSTGKGLLRIPDGGGPAETIAPRGDGDFALVLPTMLPGGKAILFVSAYGTDVDRNAIEVLTLADRRRKIVARGHSPRYLASSPGAGYLVYNNRTTLFAIPFDLETLETRGTAVPVLDDVANDFSTGAAHFGVTGTGTLVYRRAVGGTSALTTVQWVDSAGKQAPLMAKPGGYQDLRLSPDGTQVAVTVRDVVGQDVWVYDLRRDTLTRLTFGGAVNSFPTWSPDGLNIVFSRLPGGLFQARADGASPPTPLTQVNINTQQFPWSFAPDGKRLAYTEAVASGQLWTLPLEAQRGQLNAGTPEPFLKSSFSDGTPAFSPDGRWLAYRSSESGTNEVYVRGFPPPSSGAGGKWPISNGGGLQPHWSPNGRELLYRSGDQVMAVGYTAAGDTFVAEKPRVWIPKLGVAAGASANTAVWDLAPDGKRVAVITPVESASTPTQEHEVVFLQNFVDELRRRVPLGK